MTEYYLTIAAVTLFSYMAQKYQGMVRSIKGEKNGMTKFLLFMATAVLVFVAGFRYMVGADFYAYYNAKNVYAGQTWDRLLEFDDPGIAFLSDIVAIFTDDGGAYVFFFSLITIALACKAIFRESDSFAFSALLFIFCGCWHGSFNAVRQCLAASIILYGYRYIYEEKFRKYAICVAVAFLFHSSAIIMIIPYFLLRNKISFINLLLLTVGTLLVSYNYDTIFSFVGFLKDEEITQTGYVSNSVNILRILVNCAPAVLALYLFYVGGSNTLKDRFCINALFINAAAMIAASNSAYLARIGIYTVMYTPIALAHITDSHNKHTQVLVRTLIIGLYAVFWYVEVSGASTLCEYQWLWERPA